MSSAYVCQICQKEFKQESQFTRHAARKTPCKPSTPLVENLPDNQPVANPVPKLKKELGQFFTVADKLQQWVFDHVRNKGQSLLEPSFGAGHLLKKFIEYRADYPITGFEIDPTVQLVIQPGTNQQLVYGDFLQQTIGLDQRFPSIIGNPPYVKTRGKGANLYITFIERCYELLTADGGELVFIVPSDFLKLTSAAPVITRMVANGRFTDFLFPNDERLFTDASVDVVCFRYERRADNLANTPPLDQCQVNGQTHRIHITNGIITFSDMPQAGMVLNQVGQQPTSTRHHTIGELFNVYVGIVSGKDEVYKVPFGNLDVLTDKSVVSRFIFTETFPTTNPQINDHLLAHKADLLARKIKKFTDANWFEWGAPRNITAIRANLGQPCIYIQTITRKSEVAFVGTVQYFGGGLICLIPKPATGNPSQQLENIARYLNTPEFQKNYIYAGRFKIGHKLISNAIIPQPPAN